MAKSDALYTQSSTTTDFHLKLQHTPLFAESHLLVPHTGSVTQAEEVKVQLPGCTYPGIKCDKMTAYTTDSYILKHLECQPTMTHIKRPPAWWLKYKTMGADVLTCVLPLKTLRYL